MANGMMDSAKKQQDAKQKGAQDPPSPLPGLNRAGVSQFVLFLRVP